MDADFGLVRHPVLARCRTITLRIGWSFYLSLQRDVSFARYVAQYRCTVLFLHRGAIASAIANVQWTGTADRENS